MSIGFIILILFALSIIGLIVWFLMNKSKENKKKAEQEAKEKAEAEAKAKAEQEAKEKAEKEAKEKAEAEAKKKAEEEAKTKKYEELLNSFELDISNDKEIYSYLRKLYDEAYQQFYNKSSLNGIPTLIIEDNFPHFYEFGEVEDQEAAFKTLIGWLFALQLSELKPLNRTQFFKIGYELGGYDKYSNIYGYTFESDPNIMRKVAAVLYVAMRGTLNPNVDVMHEEVDGTTYDKTVEELGDGKRDKVSDKDFFIDFREFLPTAPGPYAPRYKERPDETYPNEEKDEYNNLQIDRNIHEYIVENYNLDNQEHYQEVVQAIADKEADPKHLFGSNMETENYSFHPVFGQDTIGIELKDDGEIANLVYLSIIASSSSRGIMQSSTVTPKQYGRLRPGCSWEKETTKHSKTDERYNVLCDFEIEDGDGSPTGYYDKKGFWVYPDEIKSAEEFAEYYKKELWANSYPSGHSSGIMGGAMVLIELMPERADLILKALNQFAVNRTIARYHWTSDTRNGRVLGSATNAVVHASNDYIELLNKCKNELNNL